jgi:hypothetical protein
MTGDNDRHLRYWWEVNDADISTYYPKDKKRWVPYQKGGPFTRWYGNNWIIIKGLDYLSGFSLSIFKIT